MYILLITWYICFKRDEHIYLYLGTIHSIKCINSLVSILFSDVYTTFDPLTSATLRYHRCDNRHDYGFLRHRGHGK